MSSLRILNNGEWNKDPVLIAARRLVFSALGEEFESVLLGDVATFLNGTSYDNAHVHVAGALPLIRISNISDPSSQYLRTDEVLPDRFLVAGGDLLVSWSASFKSIIWPGPAGLLNQHIFKVTEKAGFDRHFIRHAIEASFEKMQEGVVGIGMMHLRRDAFLSHPIPSIPIALQRHVARYLDAVEKREPRPEDAAHESIAKAMRAVDRIEAIARKVEEARRLRGEAKEAVGGLLASRINEIFGRLARDYPSQPLSRFDPHITSGPRNWAKHYEVSGHRFYRAQDIGPSGAVLNDSRVYVSPPPGGQGRSATLVAGDLMIVITGATVGRVALFANDMEPGFVSQHVAICRLPRNQVNSEFVLWGLRGPDGQSQLLGQRYGQGKPGLNLENVGALSLPFPLIEEQQRVVKYLRAYGRVVEELAVEQESSAALMRGMLPSVLDKAFRGRCRRGAMAHGLRAPHSRL